MNRQFRQQNRRKRGLWALLVMAGASSAAFAQEAHKLTALDLAAQTYRWDNQLVEMKARCFSMGRPFYRCVTDTGTRIDLTTIYPAEARAIIDKNCDKLSNMMDSGCMFTIQFVYKTYNVVKNAGVLGSLLDGEDKSIAKDRTARIVSRQVCADQITTTDCIAP